MDETLYALNEEDRNALQDFMEKVNNFLYNTANRGNSRQEDDHQAPELYIAFAASGIPAQVNSIPPVPGDAECDIYRIVQNEAGDNNVVSMGIAPKTVYNISSADIADGTWCLIARDKSGSWIVVFTTGGSSGDIIRKVRPIVELPPITIGFSGSGTGTGPDEDSFIWDGQVVDVGQVPPSLGFITPVEQIYIIQKTITGPEPRRLLAINGIYLGDYIGIGLLKPFHTMDFRPVYVVCAAPIATVLQQVVTNITGSTSVCNGDKTVTTTIAFLTKKIAIPIQ